VTIKIERFEHISQLCVDGVNDSKEQLTSMFKQFDRDGNGYITLMEASNILQRDPFKFPASKVLTLLKQFDKDGNGKLDIEEFAGFYAEAKAMFVTYCLHKCIRIFALSRNVC